MRARVRVNLQKWDHCKAIGETPEAFIKRMENFIESYNSERIRRAEEAERETDADRKNWLEGYDEYCQKKVKKLQKEIRKALAEMN